MKGFGPRCSELLCFLQVVGNLVYYRYMNPAIVAPDGFGVLERSAGSTLQPEQRRLLGSVARLLQHAAANKSLHGDGYQVRALNQYIAQTHSTFRCVQLVQSILCLTSGGVLLMVLDVLLLRRFLQSVCDVPGPEDRFCMDQFSELLIVHRPVIYVSVSELLNVHQVRQNHPEPQLDLHQNTISPDGPTGSHLRLV